MASYRLLQVSLVNRRFVDLHCMKLFASYCENTLPVPSQVVGWYTMA